MFDFSSFFDALDIQEISSTTLILFSVIDILGSIPIILKLHRRAGSINAGQTSLIAGSFMFVFLLAGQYILRLFDIGLDDFSIAGGLVLLILGLEMILNIQIIKVDTEETGASIVPLAFPIIAGVGTFTTLLSLQADFATVNILIALMINILIVYLVVRYISLIGKALGKTGLSVTHKLMGIILLSMAVKLFKKHLFGL